MNRLLSVDEVLVRVLERIAPLSAEYVPVAGALGRVLFEEVISTVDIPPFANSSMDGYAVLGADVSKAAPDNPVRLTVVTDIPAGSVSSRVVAPGEAARIMTGAPLPEGADAVIPVEDTDAQWHTARAGDSELLAKDVAVRRAVRAGDYVRPVGEDIHTGQIVLQAGMIVRSQDIGVLVAIGQRTVRVYRRPRVAILSTGDELVDIDEPLTPGKIHNSNSYMLAGLVETYGGQPIRLPVAGDQIGAVRQRFLEALDQKPDLVISSAGVSVGARDVVRTVIEELGAIDVWRVNLRPGKPLVFGHVGDVPFFGLPGNPVSSMVTFEIFVRPALIRLGGRRDDSVPMLTAILGEDVRSDGRRSYLRVTLTRSGDKAIAHLTGTQSSGALFSMVAADGLLIVPEGQTEVKAGEPVTVWLLREFPRTA